MKKHEATKEEILEVFGRVKEKQVVFDALEEMCTENIFLMQDMINLIIRSRYEHIQDHVMEGGLEKNTCNCVCVTA